MVTGAAHPVDQPATKQSTPARRVDEEPFMKASRIQWDRQARTACSRGASYGVMLLLLLASACGPSEDADANVARGRGLKPASLPVSAQAAIYDAATRAAFDVGPGLVLLLHPLRLPRSAGYAGGDSVPRDLVAALRTRGVVSGTCTPQRDAPRNTPRCPVNVAGYIIRLSDVLRVAGDTVEVYYQAERYGAATGQRPEALRFEKIYELVGSGTEWRVAREARVREPQQ
jgi:hypothetical protein